jgi:hypothetical protein
VYFVHTVTKKVVSLCARFRAFSLGEIKLKEGRSSVLEGA